MDVLFDTHTFLWWSLQPSRLPPGVLDVLQNPATRVLLSTVSAWEAQIKIGLGRLSLEEPLKALVEREIRINRWEVLPVHLSHTWKLTDLPPLHRDPFDRLLIAQALVENAVLLSRNRTVSDYPELRTFWE